MTKDTCRAIDDSWPSRVYMALLREYEALKDDDPLADMLADVLDFLWYKVL